MPVKPQCGTRAAATRQLGDDLVGAGAELAQDLDGFNIGKSNLPSVRIPGRVGRPSIRTPEMIDRILERSSNGEPARSIFAGADMPDRSTFHRWLARSRFPARLKAALIASGQWPLT
jgi:hypothetical protein